MIKEKKKNKKNVIPTLFADRKEIQKTRPELEYKEGTQILNTGNRQVPAKMQKHFSYFVLIHLA